MFWDIILDPMRNFVSNDVSHWMIAATFVTIIVTRASCMASGSVELRQELKFGATLFLVLVGVFFLP
jgi:hypothetical protein